jgi:hypothetical protein
MRGGGFLLVLAGASVLAAGCGTQVARTGADNAGNDVLTAAVTRTAAQTARIAITTTTQMQGMSVSFTGTGLFDFAHSRGMISTQSPIGITELLVPPKTYIKFSANDGPPLPKGKTWLAVSDGVSGGSADNMLSPFGGSADPADLLASLTAISGSEKKIGADTIRGVPVTEYQVNVDPAKAAGRLPRSEREGFRQFAKLLGSGAIPVDVWVDAGNLVRRVQLALSPSAGGLAGMGGSGKVRVVESTDFYDFGVPVRVAAPPAPEVASFSEIISVAGGSGIAVGSGGIPVGGPVGLASPPKATGTLTPAQAAAAERAVTAFWAALGRDDPAAVARTVLSSQRSCVSSGLDGAPKITVSSFRIDSAEPAGTGRATIRFTVTAKASLGGQDVPVFPPGGATQWLVAAESAGHWYVDLSASSASNPFIGPCS